MFEKDFNCLIIVILLEVPAKAFFLEKKSNVQVTNYPLTVYPTLFAAILTIILFIYIEPLKEISNLIIGIPE